MPRLLTSFRLIDRFHWILLIDFLTIGVAMIFAAGGHSILASNPDVLFSCQFTRYIKYLTLK